MTVKVNPGSGRVGTGTYPSSYGYMISHDTTGGESVTIATAAASPRIDYVLAYVDKSVTAATSPVNNTNNVLKFASVAGTPSGSPVVPTLSQIQTAIGAANPYILLAQVAVAASATSITAPNITDIRNFITTANDAALGAVSYVSSGLVWTGSTLAGSMTAGKAYINVNGVVIPISASAIGSFTFTASRDTYVYLDVNGVISYNPQTNGAAQPATPATNVLIAKVVTGASAITSISAMSIAPVTASAIDFTTFNSFINSSSNLGSRSQGLTASGGATVAYSTTNPTIELKPGTYLVMASASARASISSQDSSFHAAIYNDTASTELVINGTTSTGPSTIIYPTYTVMAIVVVTANTIYSGRARQTFGSGASYTFVNSTLIAVPLLTRN